MSTPSDTARFAAELGQCAAAVNAVLQDLLSPATLPGEVFRPPRLLEAMRHATFAGGKRFRPFLLIESARLFGQAEGAFLAAAAVECLHTYSLIHDDLPAMDDDDLRRGLPTVHRAFDEATAILAGDALLTLSFDTLVRPEIHFDPAVRIELVRLLARAAGLGGMAGGQMLDLQAGGSNLSTEGVGQLQGMKTGSLIAACCEMGGVLGGAGSAERSALNRYGQALGRAFQIADDLLDIESSAQALGKATAKDEARGKATFIGVLGAEGARALLAATVEECRAQLGTLPGDTAALLAAAIFAASRSR